MSGRVIGRGIGRWGGWGKAVERLVLFRAGIWGRFWAFAGRGSRGAVLAGAGGNAAQGEGRMRLVGGKRLVPGLWATIGSDVARASRLKGS